MNNQKIIHCFLLIVLFCLSIPTQISASEWNDDYRKIEQNIHPPHFPERMVRVEQFGASTKASASVNQIAINKAIAFCSETGGGTVFLSAGRWNTGAITLKSHVNLSLDAKAVLLFSSDTKLYPLVCTRWEGLDCWNYQPLIYAYKATDVAVTGRGIIDGCASVTAWWPMCGKKSFGWKDGMEAQSLGGRSILQKWAEDGVDVNKRVLGEGYGMRPQMINFNQCENVLIEGVTLIRSPFWTIHPLLCKNVIVRGVQIENDSPNGDGCDPESCSGVLIEHCTFHTGDDCIAIKSGRNADGRKWNRASENIIIRDCVMRDGHGGIVVGSEISGGCRNVFVERCQMDSPNLDRVLRIKTNTCRGGVIEKIFVRNVLATQCREAVVKINLKYEPNEVCCRGYIPEVKNITADSVICRKSKYGVMIVGLDSSINVKNVAVKNCCFDGVSTGRNQITGRTEKIDFTNTTLNGTPLTTMKEHPRWSEWMVQSEMQRNPQSYRLDFARKPKWDYAAGIELESFLDVYQHYGDQRIMDYLQTYIDAMIAADGSIRGYQMDAYNLDQIRTGKLIYRMNQMHAQSKLMDAMRLLYRQLQTQPRTENGIWWHKQIYPHQTWLDGLFMAQPFYASVAPLMTENVDSVYNDVMKQIVLAAKCTYDSVTGLNRHAWDETHTMFWADKQTGRSPHCWGRAEGWLTMTLVELLDVLPSDDAHRETLVSLLGKVLNAVVRFQDPQSGLWYQVMDELKRKGNYLEATCSCMFTYVLLKSYRKGYVDQSYFDAGIKGFNAILKHFIQINSEHTITLKQCCSVAGLGGTDEAGKRNGSFEYYIQEPIRENDPKGVGPFIWAALEMGE
jgi:unsaturated rhamnogalacturonyl hydrolase